MKRRLSVRHICFKGLHRVLMAQVGISHTLSSAPLITAGPQFSDPNCDLRKHFSGAGFEALIETTARGADDDALKKKIECLSSETTSELVLVTSDKDFIPVVTEKQSQGIKVYWVACKNDDSWDPALRDVSKDVLELADRGIITFVDLSRFTECITLKQRGDDGRVHNVGQSRGSAHGGTITITVRLHRATNRAQLELISTIASLKDKYGDQFDYRVIG